MVKYWKMNQFMNEQNTNDQALAAMASAERSLLDAYQNFLSMRQAIEASEQSVAGANATSINRECPQYQAITAQFQSAFSEVKIACMVLETAFRNPMLKHMIQRGSIEATAVQQQEQLN